jgi:hypothetical protein
MISIARRAAIGAVSMVVLAASVASAQSGPRFRGVDMTIGGVFADDFGLPVQLTGFDGWFIQTRTQRMWTPDLSFYAGVPSIFGSTSTCGRGGCGQSASAAMTASVNLSSSAGAASPSTASSNPGAPSVPGETNLLPYNLPDWNVPVVVTPEPSAFALLATSLVGLGVMLRSRRRGA